MKETLRATAEWVKKLRQQLHMTQEELAQALGVTVSTVNRWEAGHRKPSRLARRALLKLEEDNKPT